MAKSIKQNFLYNVLLNVSSVVFPLVTSPYVARVLESDGVGLFNFANTYAGYFALVALLGIPTYGVREVAKLRDDKQSLSLFVSEMMSIAVITTVAVSTVYIVTIFVVGQLTINYILFLLAGFAIYLAPFKINWYYQGIEEFGYITFRSLIIRTVSLVCLFLFVRQKDDLIIYLLLSVIGGVAADVWNFIKMWKSGIQPKLTIKGLKKHISPLMALYASSIAISIYTVLDTLMLGFIKDYAEVGYYSNAMHISKLALSIVTSLSLVVVSRVAYYVKTKNYEKIDELMNKSFSVVSFISFPAAIGLVCVAPIFVPLFFGHHFSGSIIPLQILSMLIIAIGLSNLTGVQILIAMGFDKLFLQSVLWGTVSNFLLNCVLIPFWGGVGASIASVVAETLILFVTTYYVYLNTHVRIRNWKDIIKSLIGSLVFIPLIWCLSYFIHGWLLVGTFLVLGTILYLVIEGVFKNSSVDLLKPILVDKLKITKQ